MSVFAAGAEEAGAERAEGGCSVAVINLQNTAKHTRAQIYERANRPRPLPRNQSSVIQPGSPGLNMMPYLKT